MYCVLITGLVLTSVLTLVLTSESSELGFTKTTVVDTVIM